MNKNNFILGENIITRIYSYDDQGTEYSREIKGKICQITNDFVVIDNGKYKESFKYSEPFWYGKNKDHNYTYFRINKNGWLIVVDRNKTKLITLYKIDLGLGEEFNKQYISEMKKLVENITIEIEEEKNQWAEKNEENNKAIEEMKAQNNLLQAQIKANNDTIDILEKTKDN